MYNKKEIEIKINQQKAQLLLKMEENFKKYKCCRNCKWSENKIVENTDTYSEDPWTYKRICKLGEVCVSSNDGSDCKFFIYG